MKTGGLFVALTAGLEPTTPGLGNRCSILLSYESKILYHFSTYLFFSQVVSFPHAGWYHKRRRTLTGESGLEHRDYMCEAIKEAELAAVAGDVPVGAVIVRNGQIIARAHNEKEALKDPTCHAEILTIRAACQKLGDWRLDDCTLYVTLEPCPMCAGAMVSAHLGALVFGAPDSAYGACGSMFQVAAGPHLSHRVQILGGIEETACTQLLNDFFARRRSFSARNGRE